MSKEKAAPKKPAKKVKLTANEAAKATSEFMGALEVMTRLNLNPSSAKVVETMVGFYS